MAYDNDNDVLECLDFRPDNPGCDGPVEFHSINGYSSFPRCEKHWFARLDRRENSMELYADSDVAPDWFDPADAGESWDGDY